MKNALVATIASAFIVLLSLAVGTQGDYYFLILFIVTASLFFFGVLYIQEIYRNTIKDIAEPGGLLEKFFSKRSSFLVFVSITVSFIFAFMFISSSVLLLRLDGGFAFNIIMIFAALASVFFLLSYKKAQFSFKDEVKENHANQAGIVLMIFVFSLVFSFIPNLIPSIQDYNVVIKDTVNFSNFTEHALDRRVEALEQPSDNDVSRKLLNIVIIVDSFRLAITNEVYKALSVNNENDTFSIFAFLFIFMANLLKTFPYILSFIVLSLGISRITPIIIIRIEPIIIKVSRFIKTKLNKSDKTKKSKKEVEHHENN